MNRILPCLLLAAALPVSAQFWDEGTPGPDEPAYTSPAFDNSPVTPEPSYTSYSETGGYDASYDMGIDPIYSTPDSAPASHESRHAFVPNEAYFEHLAGMRGKGGGGHVRVSNYFFSMPLNDPSRATWMGWSLDAKLSLRETRMEGGAVRMLDEHRLTTLGLHASLSHKLGRQSQVQLGFTPNFSTDFDNLSSRDFYVGGYAVFASRYSPNFSYSVGVALMPSYYEHYVLPMVNFRYRLPSQWELALEASRLSFTYARWEQFRFGPFFQWNNGIWTVHRHRSTEQLRLNNVILGIGAEGNGRVGSVTLRGLFDVGATVHNSFRFKDKTGSHTHEKFHAKPGWYVRAGLGVNF